MDARAQSGMVGRAGSFAIWQLCRIEALKKPLTPELFLATRIYASDPSHLCRSLLMLNVSISCERVMRNPIVASLVAFLLAPAITAAQSPAKTETGFLDRSVSLGGKTYRYQIFVPASYAPTQRWPVILFLHGAGERGTDGYFQTQVGLGTAIRQNVSRVPAISVFPR